MIFYYSARGIGAETFAVSLEMFTEEVVECFDFEALIERDYGTPDLLVIDGVGVHHRRLSRLMEFCSDLPTVLISDVSIQGSRVRISSAASMMQIGEICCALLGKKRENFSELCTVEAVCLKALCRGASNSDIARDCGVPLSSVKYYLQSIYAKMGVKNRTQAALKARNDYMF